MQNLIIGSTGSGKTQSIVLPLLKTSIKAGESFIINDIKGDICKVLGDILNDSWKKIWNNKKCKEIRKKSSKSNNECLLRSLNNDR